MSKVRGKNVLVLFYDTVSATYKNYACAMSCDLNLNTDIAETSIVGAGSWATFRGIKNSFDGSISGLTNLQKANHLSLSDLRAKQILFTELLMRFQRTDEDGNVYLDEGKFIISKSSDSGPHESMNSFTVELKGTGPLIQSTSIVSPISPVLKYGATYLDTTINNPTEDYYISSVDAIFSGNEQLNQTFLAGASTVTITNFGNTVDRVLFIQVPASEAAFTKWSESGNSLQQNIDIDQTFAGNGLWFKTIIYGNNLYVTRLQTSFTGTLILSR